MKNTTFSSTKLKDMWIKTLVEKLGRITAKVIETKDNIEIILPSLSKLATIFIEALQPKCVQLTFHDFLNSA